jgi:hypothetical protein
VGWDENGVPTHQTLNSLGLSGVDSKLSAMGFRT